MVLKNFSTFVIYSETTQICSIMKKLLLFALLSILTVSHSLAVHAQKTIDINAPDNKRNALVGQIPLRSTLMDRGVEKCRSFNYNPALWNISSNNIGDTLLLNLFEDVSYKALIKNAYVVYDDILGISAEIVGQPFAYCYITVSEDRISLVTDVLGEGKKYFINGKKGDALIMQIPASKLPRFDQCETIDLPKTGNTPLSHNLRSTNEDEYPYPGDYDCKDNLPNLEDINTEAEVEINVMVVYTENARSYIEEYQGQGKNIVNDVIVPNILSANQAMENSNAGIKFKLVHTYKTDTQEETRYSQTSDLYRLMKPNDGYFDEAFDLKIEKGADLVVIFPKYETGGGLAHVLQATTPKGNYDICFSSVNVVAADDATSYAVVHEMAHNMGCGHDKEQNSYPGPGMYSYSAGWHGLVPDDPTVAFGGRRCTVMAYPQGGEFEPSGYLRIPYFSSPNLAYHGTTIGDAQNSDNVRTLKDTKYYISQYRNHKINIEFVMGNARNYFRKEYGDPDPDHEKFYTIIYGKLMDGDRIVVTREPGESVGDYPTWGAIHRGDVDVTCEYFPYIEPGNLMITKKTFRLPDDTIVKYTGNEIPIMDLSKIPTDIKPTITYSGIGGTTYPESQNAPTELGTYNVHVYFVGNKNANGIDKNVTLRITDTTVGVSAEAISDGIVITPSVIQPEGEIIIQASVGEDLLKNAEVLLYNMSGICVKKKKISSGKVPVKAPSLPGTYIISIGVNGKSIKETKIIVK